MYSWSHKFTYALQNLQKFDHLKKWGFIKFVFYFLFGSALNKLFHITYVYIYSTRHNKYLISKEGNTTE